jgi:hypothetical protein
LSIVIAFVFPNQILTHVFDVDLKQENLETTLDAMRTLSLNGDVLSALQRGANALREVLSTLFIFVLYVVCWCLFLVCNRSSGGRTGLAR